MAPQRWTDEMLDRQADQISETRGQLSETRGQLSETRTQIDALLEGQRMLIEIYQQEHEARVRADRRFNEFIEQQHRINERLTSVLEEIQKLVRFSRENGSQN